MARKSTPHCRRASHHSARRGGLPGQNVQSSAEGPDDSAKAAKASKAQKPRKA